MLENTNFEHYQHVDMWLVHLLKKQKARGILLFPVLAGFGHRVSMSTSQVGEQKFGGCFLPEKPKARPMRQEEKDNYIYQYAPAGIRQWVEACGRELGRPSQLTSACLYPVSDAWTRVSVDVVLPVVMSHWSRVPFLRQEATTELQLT